MIAPPTWCLLECRASFLDPLCPLYSNKGQKNKCRCRRKQRFIQCTNTNNTIIIHERVSIYGILFCSLNFLLKNKFHSYSVSHDPEQDKLVQRKNVLWSLRSQCGSLWKVWGKICESVWELNRNVHQQYCRRPIWHSKWYTNVSQLFFLNILYTLQWKIIERCFGWTWSFLSKLQTVCTQLSWTLTIATQLHIWPTPLLSTLPLNPPTTHTHPHPEIDFWKGRQRISHIGSKSSY